MRTFSCSSLTSFALHIASCFTVRLWSWNISWISNAFEGDLILDRALASIYVRYVTFTHKHKHSKIQRGKKKKQEKIKMRMRMRMRSRKAKKEKRRVSEDGSS